MDKKVSRIVAAVLLVIACAFVFLALANPQASFPWGNGITYTFYAVYIAVVVVLFIAPWKKGKQ